MTQMMRYLVLNVLGLALAVFGIFHAIAAYPAPNVFDAVGRDLPMLGALASFGAGVALVIVGLMLLVPWILRLRKRRMALAVPVCSGIAQQPSRGRLFKQTNRSNHGETAMNCRAPPGTVIHQNSSSFDFLREANGFRFAGIHAEREI